METQTFRTVAILFAASALASAQVLPNVRSQENAVFISGEVRLADGSKPADPVRIQRVCKGSAEDEGWTDSEGRFSFKVEGTDTGTSNGADTPTRDTDLARPIGNSTVYSNPVTSSLRDCVVQAVLAGYWSERVVIAVKNTLDSTNVGQIVLHPVSRADAFTVSTTTLAAPANAKKAFEKGMNSMREQKWDAAVDAFTKAVKAYPKFAIAWFELGLLRESRNDAAGATEAWRSALQSDPKYVKPFEGLAALAQKQQNWLEAEKYSGQWIELDPEAFPMAYLYNAVAKANLNKAQEAEAAARKGLQLDKDRKIARLDYVLGLLLMQKHEYAESAKCLQTYLDLAPNAKDADAVRAELTKLEAAAGTPKVNREQP
jgi:tetratricopeptide (TPR) repeat protein